MSTLKTIYLQHLNGANTNATLDANGNMTVTGTVCGASSNMFRNRIINGDMRIDQRNAGASVTISNVTETFVVDRFVGYKDTGTISSGQSSVAPTGFSNSIIWSVTSGATATSGQYFFIKRSEEHTSEFQSH